MEHMTIPIYLADGLRPMICCGAKSRNEATRHEPGLNLEPIDSAAAPIFCVLGFINGVLGTV